MDPTSLADDDAIIPFEGSELSLFAAAISLANDGNPISYSQSMLGDTLERGANMLLGRLRMGEWKAKGINPISMLRETIPDNIWEKARYDPPLFTPCHQMDFVERQNGNPTGNPTGLGGTLELYDKSGRWVEITVKIPKSGEACPPTEVSMVLVDKTPARHKKISDKELHNWSVELVRSHLLSGSKPTVQEVWGLARSRWPEITRDQVRKKWVVVRPGEWAKTGPTGPRKN